MNEKIIETENFKVIVTDGNNEKLQKPAINTKPVTLLALRDPETKKTEIYLDGDCYDSPEARAIAISRVIFQCELNNVLFYEIEDEDVLDERGFTVGEELIEILKQLR